MQEALLSLLLQHLVVAMWWVHSRGREREAVLALRTSQKRGIRAQRCSGQGLRAGTQLALVTIWLWAQGAKLQLEEMLPRSAQLPAREDLKPPGREQTPPSPNHLPSRPSLASRGQHGDRESRPAPHSTLGHCQQRAFAAGAQLIALRGSGTAWVRLTTSSLGVSTARGGMQHSSAGGREGSSARAGTERTRRGGDRDGWRCRDHTWSSGKSHVLHKRARFLHFRHPLSVWGCSSSSRKSSLTSQISS